MVLVFIIVGSFSTGTLLSPPSRLYASGGQQAAEVARLSGSVAAPTLPGGPTGQLLPPGTMAAPYTFRNSYSAGQCTWYVAGRRQIPHGWGNARTWLPRARAAGWSTGIVPAVGAVAWTASGYYGHVALVEAIEGAQIQITEMNYLGTYQIDRRWVPATSFQYIY